MNYRYFKYSPSGPEDVYRWPDNGKDLVGQNSEDVELYLPNGTWDGRYKGRLYREEMDGWFSPSSDELSEGEALIMMAAVTARAMKKAEEQPK